MPDNLTHQILRQHLVSGELRPGAEIGLAIDQTLTQDATGTMAYLQFEATGVPRVRTQLSVSYVDHNTLQTGPENADDHRFLQSIAAKHGILFSRPGNGICHQVHLERFGVPGQTLLGSDSHTPTCGGLGMIAIGAGGLDVAVAMAGGPFFLACPAVVGVELTGRLTGWASAKDVILEILRRLTVKGGVGKVLEYFGNGVRTLSVPERATITNMGAELGATTSIFPNDSVTNAFLCAQRREAAWRPLAAEPGAAYDETIRIDLSALEPLVAQPHSPDKVAPVRELAGRAVDQVCIGSCTNSSYRDLALAAAILRGKHVHPGVSLCVSPGSAQVLRMTAKSGVLLDLIASGARLLECACGPCIGMGHAPPSGGVSVRTFNRNFESRSGTPDAGVYLTSPAVAASAAVYGTFIDPAKLGMPPAVAEPPSYEIDDSMIVRPSDDPDSVEVIRGPNIKPLPRRGPLADRLDGEVLLKVGDNITTDHIMPAGAKILPLRSNIPAISEHVFEGVDPDFARRAHEKRGGFIVGGINYGQGSSREHAALAPMYLGIKAVLAKSFARIHRANLVNFCILPLAFVNADDYDRIAQGDRLEIVGLASALAPDQPLEVQNATKNETYPVTHELSARQIEIVRAGGLLNYTLEQARNGSTNVRR